MTYTCIRTEQRGSCGLVTLDRPAALNALSDTLMDELSDALDRFEADDGIICILLTGSDKAFAAGADISAMVGLSWMDAYRGNYITRNWERIRSCRKPVIAAVRGYALGGGCELAMMCDIIVAGENATFGQPEVRLGIPPGAGGTQRLPRAVGKAKAMDLCLTARSMGAQEAERAGLVSRVVPDESVLDEALKIAETMASYSLPALMMIKESINRAFEGSLSEGLLFERRNFHAAFALDDQKEGMAAFLKKRKARFRHR